MLTFVLVALLVVGVNTLLWTTAGVIRVVAGAVRRRRPLPRPASALTPDDVAILVAAHNEELVISETIVSARRLVGPHQTFIISDGSGDATARLAREAGAQVLELSPNRGKAGALLAGIDEFRLAERFEVVLLLDADTQLAADYLETALPLFDDADVVAVAGRATTLARPQPATLLGRILIAYRERVYVAMQVLHKFGQAGRHANAVTIVPGFASMYRSRILDRIDIAAPGLAIEDYNMTFSVHAQKLGRIAFHPAAAIAHTQDPDRLSDYIKQVRRWSLGFWQTVARYGAHLGTFWFALALFIVELVTSCVLVILVIPAALLSASVIAVEDLGGSPAPALVWFAELAPPLSLLLGVLVPDYLMTVLVTVVTRRPAYLLLGLAFPFLRLLDAVICLRALAAATLSSGGGVWSSPPRRTVERVS